MFLFPTQIRVTINAYIRDSIIYNLPAISSRFEHKNMLSGPVFFTVPMSQHPKLQKYGFNEYWYISPTHYLQNVKLWPPSYWVFYHVTDTPNYKRSQVTKLSSSWWTWELRDQTLKCGPVWSTIVRINIFELLASYYNKALNHYKKVNQVEVKGIK